MKWIVIMMAMIATPALAKDKDDFKPYRDTAGMVVRHATEQTHPFLFRGEEVGISPHEKHRKKYAPSIRKFSSVQDCLQRAERRKAQPDLTKIDWRGIDTNEDAAVCLFRIASSYATPKDMENWMNEQGFKTTIIVPPASGKDKIIVSGNWNTEKNGSKFYSNWFVRAWIYLFAYGESYSATYDENNKVYLTKVSQSYL